MCYRLYLASPLTLSEVRSMLPDSLVAELLNPSLQRFFQDHLHQAKTAVVLLRGGCSCDLVGRRHPDPAEDERALRTRYRREHVPRTRVIEAMERHRVRPRWPPVPEGHWSAILAGFVAEHARNAGDALYSLDFMPELERRPEWATPTALRIPAAQVKAHPVSWLPERTPVVVTP